MSTQINKTQLNKLKRLMQSGKEFLDKKELSDTDDSKYSKAITMSVLREYYDLDQATAFNALTEGSGDNKIDGFYYGDTDDELDVLVLIQSKYKKTDGDKKVIHEDDIKICIQNALSILNGKDFDAVNPSLRNKVVEYRQKLVDAEKPSISIKLFFATNGIISEVHKNLKVVSDCKNDGIEIFFVDATKFGNQSAVTNGEIYINLKDKGDRTDSVFSIGESQYDGLVASCSIKELMIFYEKSGANLLLNENVRFLLKSSSINKQIKDSFIEDPKRFCYLNNGISIVCSKYKLEPTGLEITKVVMDRPSVVNGGQTLATLYQIYSGQKNEYSKNFDEAKILLRIYQTPADYGIKIAQATNSQNPINTVDLHSNDSSQIKAQSFFSQLGIGLIIKSGIDTTDYDDIIKSEAILQIYASLYLDDPAKAKLSKSSVFREYYSDIFNDDLDECVCKKLYRCYSLSKYINEYKFYDEVVKKNAYYSIIYCMGKVSRSILNENIPWEDLSDCLKYAMNESIIIINKIIKKREKELGVRFSMNNLFKSRDIKYLIDIEINRKNKKVVTKVSENSKLK